MKIITKLAHRYILKNKKRSLSIIFGIVIATILITIVITLLSSYQQYLVKSVRSKENWEIELKNITYRDSCKIANNNNIKEISISHELGITEEVFGNDYLPINLYVKEFDDNALKNSNMEIVEGRLPKRNNELIISNAHDKILNTENPTKINIGDNLSITLNGIKKDYIVVGKVNNSKLDYMSFADIGQVGGISYLESSCINNDEIVDVGVLTKNIQQVYRTGRKLTSELGINQAEQVNRDEQINQITEEQLLNDILNGKHKEWASPSVPSIEYNTELLNYECVIEGNGEFAKIIITIGVFIIIVLGIVTIGMIKALFNLSYMERINELGRLSSIGMNKKQIVKMISNETNILGIIAIIIGTIMGAALSYFIIYALNKIIKQIAVKEFFDINSGLDICMSIPFMSLIWIVIIMWIIITISSKLPLRKMNKISCIEAIKNKVDIHISRKQVKYPKLVEKLFKYEGVLSFKNIKRDKSRFNAIVGSLTISLVLFLCINGLIYNIDKLLITETEDLYDDYEISITPKSNNYSINIQKTEKIMKYLEEHQLVDKHYATIEPFFGTNLELEKNRISDIVNKIQNDGVMYTSSSQNQDIKEKINIEQVFLVGDSYNEILKKANVTELKGNEVIISNYITEKTKYGNKIELTKLHVGDSYDVDIGKAIGKANGEKETFIIARYSR